MENTQPTIILCGGGGIGVRRVGQCFGLCGKLDARIVDFHDVSGWYPPRVYCECGDGWGDGEMFTRPFARGWRARAQADFERRWTQAHPVGSRPVYDEDHFLTGVTVAP